MYNRLHGLLPIICAIITDSVYAQNTSSPNDGGMPSSTDDLGSGGLRSLSSADVTFTRSILVSSFFTTTSDVYSSSTVAEALSISTASYFSPSTNAVVLPTSSANSVSFVADVLSSSSFGTDAVLETVTDALNSESFSQEGTISTTANSVVVGTATMTTALVGSYSTSFGSSYSVSVNSQQTDTRSSFFNNSVNTTGGSHVPISSNYNTTISQFTSDLGNSRSYSATSDLWQSSGQMLSSSSSLVSRESVQSSISATKTITEGFITSHSSISISSLNGFTTDQVTSSSTFILSSSSSDYGLPGISSGTNLYQTTASGSVQSGILDSLSAGSSSSRYVHLQTTSVPSAADQPSLTTPITPVVTSALDIMPSSSMSTTEHPHIAELRKQINDYKDIESSYRIAVIVLSLILALLIALIALYIYRRRKYYQEKQARLGGAIDDDLFENTQMRPKAVPYFNPQQSHNLRISGRISTASLGEDEPLGLLRSFNRGRKSEDLTEETVDLDSDKNHQEATLDLDIDKSNKEDTIDLDTNHKEANDLDKNLKDVNL